jgi:hypothetical protein
MAGAFVLLWLSLVATEFPGIPVIAVITVAAGLAGVGVAIMLWTWLRVGGYTAYWSLRRWVRGGPVPGQVSRSRRLRYLKPLADMGSGSGWVFVGLAGLWVIVGVLQALTSGPAALGHLSTAAVWATLGGYRIVFTHRWGPRAVDLYNETLLDETGDVPSP